jgi:threonine dehydrogenase-like Zn-dependent dehydrogenase
MRAVVTDTVGSIALLDVGEPPAPGPGQVELAVEAVGICGSDFHFFLGELSAEAGGAQFPRVQGHEVCARIAALGPDCRDELAAGARVAVWPVHACGGCYPCRIGRINNCDNFKLIGIHIDGGLQERFVIGQEQVFPIEVQRASTAALVEPLSIAVRSVRRARLAAGERAVVLGAGPIGQCICLVARDRGAEVLVLDIQASRLELSAAMGAQTLVWRDRTAAVEAARAWTGGEGPPVVFDATGAPDAVRAMVEMVSSAGRAVQVGMSGEEVTFRLGHLTEKELDLLGVSCCDADDFAEAVRLAERSQPLLAEMVSHEFPLEQAPAALRFAIDNPTEVMKVVILGE